MNISTPVTSHVAGVAFIMNVTSCALRAAIGSPVKSTAQRSRAVATSVTACVVSHVIFVPSMPIEELQQEAEITRPL